MVTEAVATDIKGAGGLVHWPPEEGAGCYLRTSKLVVVPAVAFTVRLCRDVNLSSIHARCLVGQFAALSQQPRSDTRLHGGGDSMCGRAHPE